MQSSNIYCVPHAGLKGPSLGGKRTLPTAGVVSRAGKSTEPTGCVPTGPEEDGEFTRAGRSREIQSKQRGPHGEEGESPPGSGELRWPLRWPSGGCGGPRQKWGWGFKLRTARIMGRDAEMPQRFIPQRRWVHKNDEDSQSLALRAHHLLGELGV